MSEADACRADVWLWRARFFKTRTLAAKFLDEGRVRLTRSGQETRIDKPARVLKVGDRLVFALGGRLFAISIEGLGERRGPAAEARQLFVSLDETSPSFPAQRERGTIGRRPGPVRG